MRAVIGYDGSPSANIAIDLAASLPWPDGSTLRVVSVVDAARFETIYFPVGPQDIGQLVEKEARLDEVRGAAAADRLARDGLTVEHIVAAGRPSRVLVSEAVQMKADLIIVGSRGQNALLTTMVGSVSAETIDQAPMPVLVARQPAIRRVLAADDGSDAAAQAINCLIRWPLLESLNVDVMSVVPQVGHWGFSPTKSTMSREDDPNRGSPERSRHRQIAEQAAHRLQACGHPADWIVSSGQPASEIVHAAADHHDDLIVIGTRGHTGLERLLVGSVSRRVVTHANCSVLVVQPPHLN